MPGSASSLIGGRLLFMLLTASFCISSGRLVTKSLSWLSREEGRLLLLNHLNSAKTGQGCLFIILQRILYLSGIRGVKQSHRFFVTLEQGQSTGYPG